ncbi:DUF4153 domain-containing protein [Siccibacter turicensis]|uniref:DUF4153 domain-containing protein n=1 Tax=Siccibacter turicensis TaxID=357233 RepID=UPI0004654FAA|nr:DUF4153 domain-containing protein [Siccibacter turicensis]
MKSETPLSAPLRWVLPLMGMLQGGVIYLLNRTTDLFSTPAEHGWLLFVLAGSMALSSALIFAARSLRQPLLWLGIAALLLLVAAQCAWLVHALQGLDTWDQRDALRGYVLTLSGLLFLTLPWLQSRLEAGRWGDFPSLFRLYWHNGLALLLSLLATGLSWLVLWLCASLFSLIGIDFFNTLFFDNRAFIHIFTGCIVAMTVTLCRSNPRLMLSVQHLLTLVATGLLPAVGAVMVLFMLALPGVGMAAISRQISGAGLLNTLCLLYLLLMALVWYPGRDAPPYMPLMRRLLLGALLFAPVCALLAAWAVWLRVAQYGWTPDRLYAALITVVSLLWSVGYVISLARQRRSDSDFSRTGKVVLMVAPLFMALVYTPILNPWRLSVHSQMARIEADKTRLDSATITMLSNSLRWGREALRTLQDDPAIQGNPALRRLIKEALSGRVTPGSTAGPDEFRQIPLAAPQPQPEPAFWATLAKQYVWRARDCLPENGVSSCMLLAQDLNGDGQPEWILFNFSMRSAFVMSKQGGAWQGVGYFYTLPKTLDASTLRKIAQSSRLTTLPQPWRDLSIDGERLPFAAERE